MTTGAQSCWLQIAGDIRPVGGMDSANFALARHLAADGSIELHLVAHRVARELADAPGVRVHPAWRPFGSQVIGAPLMRRAGRRWAARLAPRGVRVVANGGNCDAGDVTWVHYVHAAYSPVSVADPVTAAKDRWRHPRDVAHERAALHRARLVVCNSRRTQTDVVDLVGVSAERTRVVYYGSDRARFRPADPCERRRERERLGWSQDRPVAVFIGALGDRRKGFDTLLAAWAALSREAAWDSDLVAIGSGTELPAWRERARDAGVSERVRFLGYRHDVDRILAGADLVVHPVRYEAYGLSVHEALSSGVPAIVSRCAGVAERYPADLQDLLLADPEDTDELVERLRMWRRDPERWRRALATFGESLRERTWDDMAAEIVAAIEACR